MKVWLPFITGGSGSDVFTRYLARGLQATGHQVELQQFASFWQYCPWGLKFIPAPPDTDIVLANSWNAFAFKRKGIKLVAVEHLFVLDPALLPYKTFPQAVFHNTFVKYFENATNKQADELVAVSQYTANAYQRVLGGKLPRVILNGVDTTFFCPDSKGKQPLDNRVFRMLFVGNLSRRKGADMLLNIMEGLGPGFELSYTSGLRVDDMFKNIRQMNPLGRLDQSQVRAAYRNADVLLFPTRLEGLPLAAIEAMACGTPVVASNTSSLPEVVEDCVNGRLCDKDDVSSFCTVLQEISKAPEELAKLGKMANEIAVRYFSIDRMVEDYVQVFSSDRLRR